MSEAPAPTKSLAEMQMDAIRELTSAFNAHDPARIAALYADDARIGGAGPSGWTEETGRAGIETINGQLFAAIPDLKWASPRVYLTGKTAIQEWELKGTHQGDQGSQKATGKTIGVRGASVYVFDDNGRILRDSTYYDAPTIQRQLASGKTKTRSAPELTEGDPMFITAAGIPDDNRNVPAVKALLGTFESRDDKAYFGALARDVTKSDSMAASDLTGAAAVREQFRSFLRAFPTLNVEPRQVWGFGERVVAEVAMTGTQKSAYQGIQPSKSPIVVHQLDIYRFDPDGKVIDITSYGSSQEYTPTSAARP